MLICHLSSYSEHEGLIKECWKQCRASYLFLDLYSFSCIQATADVGFLGQRMEQDAVLQRSLVLILCTFLLPACLPPLRLSRGCGERSMRGEVKKKREKRLICSFTGAAVQLSPSPLPDSLSSSILRTSALAVCSSSSSAELFLSACFLSRSQTDWYLFSGLGLPVWMSLESFHYQKLWFISHIITAAQ